jgi:hypothetical protein
MARDERARVEDLRDDIRSLDGSHFLPVAPGFRFVFSGFERVLSVVSRHSRRTRNLPAHNDAAMIPEGSGAFADDYATFDRLSVHYGGLFRGSVIVNYLLGVVAVGFTVSSILPQPRFVSPSGVWLFPEFAGFAAAFELLCIVMIGVIFFYGQTPEHETPRELSSSHPRSVTRLVAHRWHERWLEYRVLAERFRYIELMLSISPGAAHLPPFAPAERRIPRWYDRYFVWRTQKAKPAALSVHEYREQALALMLEQIEHHDANSSRRGAIARRLHKVAVWLFFSSLVLCAIDLLAESNWPGVFNDNFKSLVLFGAVMAPTLSAAIHGILATTEYTKVAESSRETADRIAPLVATITAFPGSEEAAGPEALAPIRDAVTAFADAAINEASDWRAMLRDKNVPLV